jgi:hypothetical protein
MNSQGNTWTAIDVSSTLAQIKFLNFSEVRRAYVTPHPIPHHYECIQCTSCKTGTINREVMYFIL